MIANSNDPDVKKKIYVSVAFGFLGVVAIVAIISNQESFLSTSNFSLAVAKSADTVIPQELKAKIEANEKGKVSAKVTAAHVKAAQEEAEDALEKADEFDLHHKGEMKADESAYVKHTQYLPASDPTQAHFVDKAAGHLSSEGEFTVKSDKPSDYSGDGIYGSSNSADVDSESNGDSSNNNNNNNEDEDESSSSKHSNSDEIADSIDRLTGRMGRNADDKWTKEYYSSNPSSVSYGSKYKNAPAPSYWKANEYWNKN